MPSAPAFEIDPAATFEVTIATDKGDIVMALDAALAPITVNHFVVNARNGFYDGLTFHRVVPEFVIQGGDPEGSRPGRPRLQVRRRARARRVHARRGRHGQRRARHQRHRSSSSASTTARSKLQPLYNLFGYVTSGIEVAQAIAVGDVMRSVTVRR